MQNTSSIQGSSLELWCPFKTNFLFLKAPGIQNNPGEPAKILCFQKYQPSSWGWANRHAARGAARQVSAAEWPAWPSSGVSECPVAARAAQQHRGAQPRVSAAEQLRRGASCIITPIPLLVPEGAGNCSLASIWRSSWTWHAKGKNSNGAKIKISQHDNFYARKCYRPTSRRISLTSNLIIQIPFQRCSTSPWRKKGLVTGSPVGKGMSVRFFLPSPPNWNKVPLLHGHLFGPSDHLSYQLFSPF